jgi:Na+:H+ antiporter, NhaA family
MKLFEEFFESEKSGGIALIICTIISLLITNLVPGDAYTQFWNLSISGMTLNHWINDGLMAVFFLMIGLELKTEFMEGHLADKKTAILPIVAAVGGMLVPAGCHLLFNAGTNTQAGAGIPIATDVAFALAVLAMLGKNIPGILKVFLIALAVIDDLCAIIAIAVFYTSTIHWSYLGISLLIFIILLLLNRFKVNSLIIYLIGGAAMWYFMHHSGVHATISGVLLALTIPYEKNKESSLTPVVQHALHKPVAFIILPLFAMANTCISLSGNFFEALAEKNSIGIMTGLVIGKPLGIILFCFLAVFFGIGSLHPQLKWKHILGIGLLAGIGFTISIFISLLAFEEPALINQSKMAVLSASVVSALLGFLWLKAIGNEKDINNM